MGQVTMSPETISNKARVIAGQHTTVAAVDALTIPGITTIISAVACLGQDQADALMAVSVTFTGAVLSISTWKSSGTDPTPIAADAFSKKVNYVVVGV